MKKFSIKKTL